MLYTEIIAVCSEIHTEQMNTLCGQNVGFVNTIFEPDVTVTTGLQRINVIVSAVYRLAICLHRKCVDRAKKGHR
jgi:hypothetical protein